MPQICKYVAENMDLHTIKIAYVAGGILLAREFAKYVCAILAIIVDIL